MRRGTAGQPAGRLLLVLGLSTIVACAPGPQSGAGDPTGSLPEPAAGSLRAGTSVGRVDFLYSFENDPAEPYYPIEGLGGCAYSPDGTLIFTDRMRGKVYGLDALTRRWFEFDTPAVRPYQPVDVAVDGFKVMVLDMGNAQINRFDLTGAFLDVLVDIRRVDPVIQTSPAAFAVDRDGRMAIADATQQQVLLLDTFQNLTMRAGDPGTLPDQFAEPSGLTFLPDGSFLVADRGNRRLALYGRLGFFEGLIGGDGQPDNPFFTPMGLAADRFGNVFVADLANGQVQVLGKRLAPVLAFGREGAAASDLRAPVDVAVGPGDLLAVADRDRAAILVYRIIYQ